MLITDAGVIIRLHTSDISTYSRVTKGVRLMRLDDDVKIVSLARTEREEDEEEAETQPEAEGQETAPDADSTEE